MFPPQKNGQADHERPAWKEGSSNTGYSLDEAWGHYAQWHKPDTGEQMMLESTHRRSLEQSALDTENRMVGARLEGGMGDWVSHGDCLVFQDRSNKNALQQRFTTAEAWK